MHKHTSRIKQHFTVRVKEIFLWRLISFSEKHIQIHRFGSCVRLVVDSLQTVCCLASIRNQCSSQVVVGFLQLYFRPIRQNGPFL